MFLNGAPTRDTSPLLNQTITLRTLIEKLALRLRDLRDQQAKQAKAIAKADGAVVSLKTQLKDTDGRIDELDERIALTPDKDHRAFWEARRGESNVNRNALQKRLDEEAQPAADALGDVFAATIKEIQDLTDRAVSFQNNLYETVDDDTLLAKLLRLENASTRRRCLGHLPSLHAH